MSRLSKFLLDILYPRSCLGCSAPSRYLCLECKTNLTPSTNDSDWINACYSYNNPLVKKAIWHLKYRGVVEIAELFATDIAENIKSEQFEQELLFGFNQPLLIPIPLSKKRQRRRGFNQAELLARYVSEQTNIPIQTTALIKTKETPSQVSQRDKASRLTNLKDSFDIHDSEKVRNRNILLIDDITTTGATLSECRKTVIKAGAKDVAAWVVAY